MPALLSALLSLGRTAKRRRDMLALAELDDHILRDIGLQRADIQAALAQPFYRDPSPKLKAACCRSRSLLDNFRTAFAPAPVACC